MKKSPPTIAAVERYAEATDVVLASFSLPSFSAVRDCNSNDVKELLLWTHN